MITFSKLYIKRACPGMSMLRHRDENFEGQEEGIERHDEWETAINAGNVPEVLAERWPGLRWRAEVAFAYDVSTDTARELGVGIKRQYDINGPLGPFEVPGTVDVLGDSPELLVIVDRKSFDPNVERAAVNAQIHAGALAACRAYSIDRADIAIHHEVRPLDVEELYALELDAFAAEIRGIVVNSARDLRTGKHCRWCSAYHDCPEQKNLLALVETGAADSQVELLLPLGSDEVAAAAYEFMQRLELLLKRLRGAVFARAAERPIPLGGGRMFRKVVTPGDRELIGLKVHELMTAKYGRDVADKAVELSATQARIKAVLTEKLPRGTVSKAMESLLAELDRSGGITRKPSTAIKEVPAPSSAQPVLKAANE